MPSVHTAGRPTSLTPVKSVGKGFLTEAASTPRALRGPDRGAFSLLPKGNFSRKATQ